MKKLFLILMMSLALVSAGYAQDQNFTSKNSERQWTFGVGLGGNLAAGNWSLYDFTAGAFRMTVNSSGYFGFGGNIAPTEIIDVTGNIKASGTITGASGTFTGLTATRIPIVGVGGLIGDDADLTFSVDTLTSTKMSMGSLYVTGLTGGYLPYIAPTTFLATNSPIFTDGTNVSIGTTSIPFKFQVKGATDNIFWVSSVSATTTIGAIIDAGSSTALKITGSPLTFSGNGGAGAEQMRITSAGNVGTGTTLPLYLGHYFGGSVGIHNAGTLGTESLTNPNLTSGTSWTQTGDMALAADAATYTHSTGVGTLQQASGTLAVAGRGLRLYKLVYTVSAVTAGCTATITTAFAQTAQTLTITAGTQTLYFIAAASPGNFVIDVTSTAGGFTLDTFSLKEVQGGDIHLGNTLYLGSHLSTTGAQIGTLTNAPTVGDPEGYLTVYVNGVAKGIPYWDLP